MNKKHGMAAHGNVTNTYRCWQNMKKRCAGKASSSKYYKSRGIKVCRRWVNSFENFLSDMGEMPKGKSLDRIDNDGNYCKENCRWASKLQQMQNTRSNVFLTLNGHTRCIAEWARFLGIPKMRIHRRLYLGWTQEEALSI